MTLPVYLDFARRPPCPWCDSHTGFALYYATYSKYDCGSYYCFRCKEHGDGIKYLVHVEGRTYPEALEALGLQQAEPVPSWAFKGPHLRPVDLEHERVRSARRTLQRTQGEHKGYAERQWDRASEEAREACMDLVWIRNQLSLDNVGRIPRALFDNWKKHGVLGLPKMLHNAPASLRQIARMEALGT